MLLFLCLSSCNLDTADLFIHRDLPLKQWRICQLHVEIYFSCLTRQSQCRPLFFNISDYDNFFSIFACLHYWYYIKIPSIILLDPTTQYSVFPKINSVLHAFLEGSFWCLRLLFICRCKIKNTHILG